MEAKSSIELGMFELYTVRAAAGGKLRVKGQDYEVQASSTSTDSSFSWSLPEVSYNNVAWSPGSITFQTQGGDGKPDSGKNTGVDTIPDAEMYFEHIPEHEAAMTLPTAASVLAKVVVGNRSSGSASVQIMCFPFRSAPVTDVYKFVNPVRSR